MLCEFIFLFVYLCFYLVLFVILSVCFISVYIFFFFFIFILLYLYIYIIVLYSWYICFCVCGFARSCMDLLQEVRMAAERLGALEEHEPIVGRECPTVALFLWQIVTSSKQDGFHHALCAPKSKSQEDRHELLCHRSKEASDDLGP